MKSLALLLLLCCLPALGQTRLRDVHKVYVPNEHWRNLVIGWEIVKFDGRKTLRPAGNCQTGFRSSVNADLFVVCDPKQADAELVTGADSVQANWAKRTQMNTACTSEVNGNTLDTSCATTGGGVNSGTETIAQASARLVSVSGETIWSGVKDNHANFGQRFLIGASQTGATYIGDESKAADRVIRQLAHDYNTSVHSK